MAKKKSKRQRIIEYIMGDDFFAYRDGSQHDLKEVDCRSYKYRQITIGDTGYSWFIGRKGAVRFGKKVSDTRSYTHKFIHV